MRIVLIGGGAREHALAWKLRQSSLCDDLICLGGNAGIEQLAECHPMRPDDLDGIARFCQQAKPDLVVPGHELPLVLGLVDKLTAIGFPTFWPQRGGRHAGGIQGLC
jgi:phosphoribosylamine--glycine ligase